MPFLGEVPLHMDIRAKSDAGRPIVATAPESLHAQIYREIAAKVWTEVERAKGTLTPPPVLDMLDNGRTLEGGVPRWPHVRSSSRDAACHEPVG